MYSLIETMMKNRFMLIFTISNGIRFKMKNWHGLLNTKLVRCLIKTWRKHYTEDENCTIVQANDKMRNIKHRYHIEIIYQIKLTFFRFSLFRSYFLVILWTTIPFLIKSICTNRKNNEVVMNPGTCLENNLLAMYTLLFFLDIYFWKRWNLCFCDLPP